MQSAGNIHPGVQRPGHGVGPSARDDAAAVGDADDQRSGARRRRLGDGHVRKADRDFAALKTQLPDAQLWPPMGDAVRGLGGELVAGVADEQQIGPTERH